MTNSGEPKFYASIHLAKKMDARVKPAHDAEGGAGMTFSSWRGVVGMINPTMRPGVTEEVIRLLPEGIGLIPLFLNIRRGTVDEFEGMMPAYEAQVAVLAECGCDLIHPHGAPPFMVQG